MSHHLRRLDARKKIQLGVLFIKAGLEDFHPTDADILYGILVEAKLRLQQNPNLVNYFKNLGKDIWIKNQNPKNINQSEEI